mgnify:CR=1 FL=1
MEHGDGECRFCETSCGPLGFFGGEQAPPPGLPKGGGNVFSTGFGPAEALRGQEGARIFLAGPLSAAPATYGVIAAAKPPIAVKRVKSPIR